ncbi:SLC13 family permease (plasmid) [Bosea vestrisii]|uniref:SLC13 family permease n=1 Tax=Bosea vestrisii TaxID=151416 RepID=UPI0024DF6C19|nr:SLC13 family permease [Bosea vestrisii]WID99882.1 SLC13 family permease [Bosea vestrisii]
MSSQMLSIYALAVMFVIATILPINMGVLAFVGAFLVGTLAAGMTANQIIAGFPGGLFLTLVGITFLFAIAQNNGTIDWLVRLAMRAVRGRIAAIPWIMFGVSALLTSVGAVSPGAVAIVAPIALGFALKYKINPLLMGLMVIHGAQAGGFSPISIYGGITNRIVAKAGLPLNEIATFLASFGVNFAVALLLFFALGGRKLLSARVDGSHQMAPRTAGTLALAVPGSVTSARPADAQAYGDAEFEAASEERLIARQKTDPAADAGLDDRTAQGPHWYRVLTLAGIILLAVLTLAYNLDIGFVAITIGLALSLIAPDLQKRAMGQVSWPEIMLITGVSTYVVVLEKMGTISFVGDSVATLASPMLAALLLCFIGAVVSAFASSTAVLGSLIPLAVPFLQSGTGVSAVGFVAAMAVASTIVDVSPFSTNGALVLANAQGVDRQAFFQKLMAYGAAVTLIAPIVVWFLFVVL